jgi:hypothetical protein
MTRIIIPYQENRGKSILLALGAIKDWAGLNMETVGVLFSEFGEGKDLSIDISGEISIENLDSLWKSLKYDGFVYDLVNLNS